MENRNSVQFVSDSNQVYRILTAEEMKLPVDTSSVPWIVEDPITKERITLDIGGQEELGMGIDGSRE